MSNDNRISNSFLAELAHILSHELRKPIGTMAGIVNLMDAGLVTDDECQRLLIHLRSCLDEMDKHSRRIGDLINLEQSKSGSANDLI